MLCFFLKSGFYFAKADSVCEIFGKPPSFFCVARGDGLAYVKFCHWSKVKVRG